MNQLINIIYLSALLYYFLTEVESLTQEPLFKKIYILVAVLCAELIFDLIMTYLRKDKLSFISLFDKSLIHALLVLLGKLLYDDIKGSPSIMAQIPGLTQAIQSKEIQVVIMIVPIIFFTTSKCFLRPY